MKKSTLITTIAMIVVVVVALSTATYAWFSSATTTSVSDSISTTASAKWIIMGGKQTTAGTTDTVAYSSSNAIDLTMLDGLYSPDAIITGIPDSATNSATFTLTPFYTAVQDGTGLVDDARSASGKAVDPIADDTPTSAANYVRVINTDSDTQDLVLTVTVVTNGDTDSDFYAANGFSTYVAWKKAGTGDNLTGAAWTRYYYGTCATTTTGTDEVYYEAHKAGVQTVSGCDYTGYAIDQHNENARLGSGLPGDGYKNATNNPITIGEEEINSGYYYQFKIAIATALPSNSAVNIAFYAWFDGWAIDNTGSNSNATVYYEFGDH